MTMTFVPAWVSALMNETWLDALASSGPTTLLEANPAASAPSSPPPSTTSVYGLLSCLGMNVIVWSPSAPEPSPDSEPPPAAQPVAMRAMVAAVAAMVAIRRVRVARPVRVRNNSIVFSFLRAPGARR